MYTLNGEHVLTQNICDLPEDNVLCCAFYEGLGNEWLERELFFTGHRRGVVNVWSKAIVDGKFKLLSVNTLQHASQFQTEIQVSAAISAIHPMPQAVYTGDENGKVVCCSPLNHLPFKR